MTASGPTAPNGLDVADSTPQCRWCGTLFQPYPSGNGFFHVEKCPTCSVRLTVPFPDRLQLDAAYAGWYRPKDGRFAMAGDSILRYLRASVARWVHRMAPPGPVLDVGAGDGVMLDEFERLGRVAMGLERVSTRPDVIEDAVADCPGEWAAIVMWHSLEHLSAPRQTLRDAAAKLKDNGVLVVAIPNAASLQFRVFGRRWLHLDLPRHLTHLTTDDLVEAMEQDGLVVIRIDYLGGGQVWFGWMDGLVKLFPGHLDLYQSVRREGAREERGPSCWSLGAGILVAPLAALATCVEVIARRAGTVRVVARRISDARL